MVRILTDPKAGEVLVESELFIHHLNQTEAGSERLIISHYMYDFYVDCEFFVGIFRNGSKTMKNNHICLPKVPVQRQKRWMVKKVRNRRLRALQTFFVVFSTSDFLILTRNSKSSRNSTEKLYFLF